MNQLMTPVEAQRRANELYAPIAGLQAEMAKIPAALEQAKAAGDASEIRRLRGQQAELASAILEAAQQAQTKLRACQRDYNASSGAVHSDVTADLDAAKAELARIEREYEEASAKARAAIASAEQKLHQLEVDCQSSNGSFFQADKEAQIAISANADLV